jgi:hypothetical protein
MGTWHYKYGIKFTKLLENNNGYVVSLTPRIELRVKNTQNISDASNTDNTLQALSITPLAIELSFNDNTS